MLAASSRYQNNTIEETASVRIKFDKDQFYYIGNRKFSEAEKNLQLNMFNAFLYVKKSKIANIENNPNLNAWYAG